MACTGDDTLEVSGDDPRKIGDLALAARLPIYELRDSKSDLEDLFFQLTSQPENRNRNLGDDDQPGQHEGGMQ